MARPLSRTHLGLIAAILAALAFAGCSEKPSGGTSASANVFQAKTEGPPGALMSQLTRLQTQFVNAEQADLDDYREKTNAYVAAVVKTTDALLSRDDVADDLKQKALEARFAALIRTAEFDPKALDRLLAEADAFEQEKTEESGLRPIAAFYRVLALRDSVDHIKGATPEQYRSIHDAVLRLGKAKPTHPQAVIALARTAGECELAGFDSLARDLYLMLAERFPDSIKGKFAKGNADRIALKSKILPNISGKDLDGKAASLESLRGKVVIIEFRAAGGCEACKTEMQHLQQLRTQYAPKGFEIFGVNLDSEPRDAAKLLKEHKIAWPNIQGVFANTLGEIPDAPLALRFGVINLPFNMLLDRDGRYIASGPGLQLIMPKLLSLLEETKGEKKQEDKVKPATASEGSAKVAK